MARYSFLRSSVALLASVTLTVVIVQQSATVPLGVSAASVFHTDSLA